MAKRMLIDAAHPEETRVVVLNGNRLEEFDFETSTKKQIKGNIYLAKVTRVEPSLQAAFVEYGGNRHGFLAFSEIHPDYYRIPVADRQAALAADRAAEQAANAREEAEGEEAEDEVPLAAGMGTPAAPEPWITRPEPESEFEPAGEASTGPEGESESDPEPRRMAETAAGDFRRAAPDDAGTGWIESPPDVAAAPGDGEPGEAEPAEDGSVADRAEDAGAGSADALHPADAAAPAEMAQSDVIETVGGDEIEEATRPRSRPFRHYKIQEVIKRRQIMLVQVTKEERGNKGAALTTYLSLAGRYCVLMPNTPRGGGVSRKITNNIDRRRLKELVSDLDMPEGMGVIVRTAGSERSKTEIKRDFEYLLRLWDEIRDLTLKSTAPALIYEEGNLIKRSIRDLYTRDLEEVIVDGDEGYRTAKAFMKMLMPSHAKRVKPYRDPSVPLFHRFQVEGQIDAIHSPVVQLRSGGYIVLNPTEALVAIDVNSGRSTKERNIEETALKTNLEAAEEIARQLRLRDLAGLIVIDFIDMEEHRNQGAVERRLKEAMRHDRARIQLGRISPFGLLELSRQRLRPSLLEASTQPCPRCNGTGHIRSTESTALHVLRAIEEEGMRRRSAEILVAVPSLVALYILNQKRATLQQTEARYGFSVTITADDTLVPPALRLERLRALTPAEVAALPATAAPAVEPEEDEEDEVETAEDETEAAAMSEVPHDPGPVAGEPGGVSRRRKRRRRRHGEEGRDERAPRVPAPAPVAVAAVESSPDDVGAEEDAPVLSHEARADAGAGESGEHKRRRRGRRGGRRRRRNGNGTESATPGEALEMGALPEADAEPMPEVETIEFVPATPAEGTDPAREIAAAFAAPPTFDTLASESVPVVEPGDTARRAPHEAEDGAEDEDEGRETEEEDAPLAAAASPERALQPAETAPDAGERAPVQYNAPPTHEVTGPPSNPRRGWWRR